MKQLLPIAVLSAMVPLVGQNVVIPDSSVEHPGDTGLNSHTNHLIMVRRQAKLTAPSGLSPQQIASAYGLGSGFVNLGSATIAIVDAYDYPTAFNDLTVFSKQFGLNELPACTSAPTATSAACFWKVYASTGGRYQTTKPPRSNCGWAQEASLDIEWAHAMAPFANIVLVEAASNGNSDLWNAVQAATAIVTATGKGEVSMSWGGSEFSGESSYDQYLQGKNIVYFASSGDTGGVTIYPGTSPYVVAAGGTSLKMSGTNFVSETGWSGSGGGVSKYEPIPSYQNSYLPLTTLSQLNGKRGVPDFSFDADPNTGVSVYDSTSCQGYSGWMVFGGTSVSAPSLAGIVNSIGTFSASSPAELSLIYSDLGTSNVRDIISGTAGSFTAGSGWDFVTGVGSNVGLTGK